MYEQLQESKEIVLNLECVIADLEGQNKLVAMELEQCQGSLEAMATELQECNDNNAVKNTWLLKCMEVLQRNGIQYPQGLFEYMVSLKL